MRSLISQTETPTAIHAGIVRYIINAAEFQNEKREPRRRPSAATKKGNAAEIHDMKMNDPRLAIRHMASTVGILQERGVNWP